MKQIILEIDAGAEFDTMPSELQGAIKKAKISWPESRLIGTSPIDGKQLILILCDIDSTTLEQWMNVECPTGELDEFGDEINLYFNLNWFVLAEEGEQVDQSLLLPYFDDKQIFDEDGEMIGYEPVTDLIGKLQVWAGRKWTY